MKNHIPIIAIISIMALSACKKDRPVSVRLVASCEDCNLTWSAGGESGSVRMDHHPDWSKTVGVPDGSTVTMQACRAVDLILLDSLGQPYIDSIGGAQVLWIYVNGETSASHSTVFWFPDSCAHLTATINDPRQ